MEFALGKIYAKFYVCQILNSLSYYEFKTKQSELQKLIEENYISENDSEDLNTNLISRNEDVEMEDLGIQNRESKMKVNNNKSLETNEKIKSEDIYGRNATKENLSQFDAPLYRRYFVYKNVVYSKVEIQGLVIEKRSLGYEEKNNYRFLVYIDDSTGVIQGISWKNKSAATFEKVERELVRELYLKFKIIYQFILD